MAGLLYYLPGKQGASLDLLKKLGLDRACANGYIQVHVSPGPDKKQGCVIAAKPGNAEGKIAKRGYYPEKQEWALTAKGLYWIGHEIKNPPAPIDLQKREIVRGYDLKLNDKNTWTIPVARIFDGGTTLPESMILGPEGQLVKEVLPQYAQFGTIADHLWDILNCEHGDKEGDPDPMSDVQAYDYAVEALCINYNINRWGVSYLRLLNTDLIYPILHSIVDFPLLREISLQAAEANKKKDQQITPDSIESSDGETDSSKIIGPQSQNVKSSAGSEG